MSTSSRSLHGWQLLCREHTSPTALDAGEIWLVATFFAGEIARSIRSSRMEDLLDGSKFTNLIVTTLHFANIVGFDLSEYTWQKYPRSCPYCLGHSRIGLLKPHSSTDYYACCCPPPPKRTSFDPSDPELGTHAAYMMVPEHLEDWQELFRAVYSHRHLRDLDRLAYHFIEEIGEVAGALALGEGQSKIAYETADVFSWTISLANAIGRAFAMRIALENSMDESIEFVELTWNQTGC